MPNTYWVTHFSKRVGKKNVMNFGASQQGMLQLLLYNLFYLMGISNVIRIFLIYKLYICI
jgi:hypothetical protein